MTEQAFRLGTLESVLKTRLSAKLPELREAFPVDVKIGHSKDLAEDVEAGKFDAVFAIGAPEKIPGVLKSDGGGTAGGTGQGTTTREFGEASGALYATGGGSSKSSTSQADGAENTGDGGSGSSTTNAGNGGSGIVIIRKHKEAV